MPAQLRFKLVLRLTVTHCSADNLCNHFKRLLQLFSPPIFVHIASVDIFRHLQANYGCFCMACAQCRECACNDAFTALVLPAAAEWMSSLPCSGPADGFSRRCPAGGLSTSRKSHHSSVRRTRTMLSLSASRPYRWPPLSASRIKRSIFSFHELSALEACFSARIVLSAAI